MIKTKWPMSSGHSVQTEAIYVLDNLLLLFFLFFLKFEQLFSVQKLKIAMIIIGFIF